MSLYSPVRLIQVRSSLVRHYITVKPSVLWRLFFPTYHQEKFKKTWSPPGGQLESSFPLGMQRWWQQAASLFLFIMQPIKQRPLLGVGERQQLTACHTAWPTPKNQMNWANQITCMGQSAGCHNPECSEARHGLKQQLFHPWHWLLRGG